MTDIVLLSLSILSTMPTHQRVMKASVSRHGLLAATAGELVVAELLGAEWNWAWRGSIYGPRPPFQVPDPSGPIFKLQTIPLHANITHFSSIRDYARNELASIYVHRRSAAPNIPFPVAKFARTTPQSHHCCPAHPRSMRRCQIQEQVRLG